MPLAGLRVHGHGLGLTIEGPSRPCSLWPDPDLEAPAGMCTSHPRSAGSGHLADVARAASGAALRSEVQIAAASPYCEALSRSRASPRVSKATSATTGPKTSSVQISMLGSTSLSTTGRGSTCAGVAADSVGARCAALQRTVHEPDDGLPLGGRHQRTHRDAGIEAGPEDVSRRGLHQAVTHLGQHRAAPDAAGRGAALSVMKAAAAMFATARSMSASASTTAAFFPPSSASRRTSRPASDAFSDSPTSFEPVKLTARSAGCWRSAAPMLRPAPVTVLSTPAGRPASASTRASSRAMTGVSEAGLRTTLLPAISAGASLRAGVSNGSFHGVIARTTPSGSWIVQDSTSRFSCESTLRGRHGPGRRSTRRSRPPCRLAPGLGEGLAHLAVSVLSSSLRSRSSWAARNSTRPRSTWLVSAKR
jgi:hypothetical protein